MCVCARERRQHVLEKSLYSIYLSQCCLSISLANRNIFFPLHLMGVIQSARTGITRGGTSHSARGTVKGGRNNSGNSGISYIGKRR